MVEHALDRLIQKALEKMTKKESKKLKSIILNKCLHMNYANNFMFMNSNYE